MSQVMAVLAVGGLLVGVLIGTKVGQARWSHWYYRKSKASIATLRRTAWAEIRYAATATLVLAALVAAFVFGISARK